MTPEVAAAVEEIRQAFRQSTVSVQGDDDGGAVVAVEPVDPGPVYLQRATWVKFHITFQYPLSDVYPHFVRPDLARVDGAPLGEAMSLTTFYGEQAIQISRRSNHLDPSTDTAALKLVKVMEWLRTR